jgi:hypothetical protein
MAPAAPAATDRYDIAAADIGVEMLVMPIGAVHVIVDIDWIDEIGVVMVVMVVQAANMELRVRPRAAIDLESHLAYVMVVAADVEVVGVQSLRAANSHGGCQKKCQSFHRNNLVKIHPLRARGSASISTLIATFCGCKPVFGD